VSPGESAAEVARHAFMVGADRAFLVATLFLAATVLLTWFAIRPSARQATDAKASDDAVILEA
jgi:electron transfer flavoprotein alpha/beta subunit